MPPSATERGLKGGWKSSHVDRHFPMKLVVSLPLLRIEGGPQQGGIDSYKIQLGTAGADRVRRRSSREREVLCWMAKSPRETEPWSTGWFTKGEQLGNKCSCYDRWTCG